VAVWTVLAGLSLLFWLGVLLHRDRPWAPVSDCRLDVPPPTRVPLVSVVIPARNEGETVGAAVRSHVESAWPRREIILVDDNSRDDTVAVAREAAREAACPFRLVEAGPLPDGWVGKVNAMNRGVREARGEYILFTDADIVFTPALIGELVAESERDGLGLNSRMVLLATTCFWERLLVPAFVYFFSLLYPFRAVSRRGSRTAAAGGGCMLVKREALEAAGGLGTIKDAIIDDIALARAIKGAGLPLRLVLTKKARSLRRYRRLWDFWQTVSRTAFTELRYSWPRLGAATVALLLAFLGPVVAAGGGFASGTTLAGWLGASATVLLWGLYVPTCRFMGVPWPYVLALPVVGLLYLCMTLHSAIRFAAGRRSSWKDRDYGR
jgi:hopene-associated glycosyltransferase HpnB